MLYDKKWEYKTTIDPLSLDGLISWMEQQNPETEYDWWDVTGKCLIGQYLNYIGDVWHANDNYFLVQGGIGGIAYGRPHTFGAALGRAIKRRHWMSAEAE